MLWFQMLPCFTVEDLPACACARHHATVLIALIVRTTLMEVSVSGAEGALPARNSTVRLSEALWRTGLAFSTAELREVLVPSEDGTVDLAAMAVPSLPPQCPTIRVVPAGEK